MSTERGRMLSLVNIHAGYGGIGVLRDVTVLVPSGTVVALVGANGAGKSTTLRTAMGLVSPMSGHITLDGVDVSMAPPQERFRRGLAYVPEGRGIFRGLTVRENLRLQAVRVSETEALDRAVQAFPVLGRRLQQVAGTLSGGEQQMLAVARAYVDEPKYLLIDEVSMGLAPVVLDEIWDFLARLCERSGVGALLVEQHVGRVLELADYVFVLDRGAVAFCGEPSEIDDQALIEQYLGMAASGS